MIVSEREENKLISEYMWIAREFTKKYKYILDYRDYEELLADCIFGIHKAIISHDVFSGSELEAMVNTCVRQARSRWFRNYFNSKQTTIRAVSLISALPDAFDPEAEAEDRDYLISFALIAARARLTSSEKSIMDGALLGLSDVQIAREGGTVKQNVQKKRTRAIIKMRALA
jgi:hypothetical protein